MYNPIQLALLKFLKSTTHMNYSLASYFLLYDKSMFFVFHTLLSALLHICLTNSNRDTDLYVQSVLNIRRERAGGVSFHSFTAREALGEFQL